MTHLEEFKLNIFNEILNGKKPFDLIENIRNLKGFEEDIKFLALKFARYAEKFTDDIRVKNCNDVTERYLNGDATRKELGAAQSAAAAAWNAANAAVEGAAWSAWGAANAAAWNSNAADRAVASSRAVGDGDSREDLGAIFVEWLRGLE